MSYWFSTPQQSVLTVILNDLYKGDPPVVQVLACKSLDDKDGVKRTRLCLGDGVVWTNMALLSADATLLHGYECNLKLCILILENFNIFTRGTKRIIILRKVQIAESPIPNRIGNPIRFVPCVCVEKLNCKCDAKNVARKRIHFKHYDVELLATKLDNILLSE